MICTLSYTNYNQANETVFGTMFNILAPLKQIILAL